MKTIYQFKNYRLFLSEFFAEKKKTQPRFSLSHFLDSPDLPSASYLKMVMNGKRNLSWDMVIILANQLGLNVSETEYFEALVGYNQADVEKVKIFFSRKLQKIKHEKIEGSVSFNQFSFLDKWYYPLIIIAMDGRKHEDGRKFLRSRIKLSDDEINEALAKLIKSGLLIETNGSLKMQEPHIKTQDHRSYSLAYKRFVRQQLELSLWAYQQIYNEGAKFFCHTFTGSQDGVGLVVDHIQSGIDKLMVISESQAPESFYQLNIQLFPLNEKSQFAHN